MSAVGLDEMFTASEISVQGSVAAGFEKVTNNLNLHQTFASQCIIHVYNVHRSSRSYVLGISKHLGLKLESLDQKVKDVFQAQFQRGEEVRRYLERFS